MKQTALSATIALTVMIGSTTAAQAACFAEYKAKRDNPLRLFHNTAQISGPCTVGNATAQLRTALAAQGLTLLKVLSVSQR